MRRLDPSHLDVTDRDTMRKLQGDCLLVLKRDPDTNELYAAYLMTIVRAVDTEKQELRLVNREVKSRKPDWPLTPEFLQHFKPAEEGNAFKAQWQIVVK